MRFSKTADYALRVMVALAKQSGARLSLHTLSQAEDIPRKFLEHVVRSLKQADLILSSPGPKGGYTLSRSTADISLAQILTAVQGPLLPMDGLKPGSMPEHLKEPLDKLNAAMNDIRLYTRQRLEAITLADLAEMDDTGVDTEPLMYYI